MQGKAVTRARQRRRLNTKSSQELLKRQSGMRCRVCYSTTRQHCNRTKATLHATRVKCTKKNQPSKETCLRLRMAVITWSDFPPRCCKKASGHQQGKNAKRVAPDIDGSIHVQLMHSNATGRGKKIIECQVCCCRRKPTASAYGSAAAGCHIDRLKSYPCTRHSSYH